MCVPWSSFCPYARLVERPKQTKQTIVKKMGFFIVCKNNPLLLHSMKNLSFILSILLLHLSIAGYAQKKEKYTISGEVRDSITGETIVGAVVKINELQTGATTNVYGFYSITLEKGDYTLVSSFIGYNEFVQKINLNKNTVVNIQLTEKLTRFGMTTAFLACLTLAILPGSFYGFLFGADFAALHPIMWLLAPGVWLFSYALIVGHYFSGHGRYQVNALASGIGLVVSLIGAILLIPSYGTQGAAVAASLSYFVTSAIVFWYFKKAGGQFTLFLQFEELKSFQTQVRQRLRSIRS